MIDVAKAGPLTSSHQKKPVKTVKRMNSAKNSPISARRSAIRPNVQTMLIIDQQPEQPRGAFSNDRRPSRCRSLIARQNVIQHIGTFNSRMRLYRKKHQAPEQCESGKLTDEV